MVPYSDRHHTPVQSQKHDFIYQDKKRGITTVKQNHENDTCQ